MMPGITARIVLLSTLMITGQVWAMSRPAQGDNVQLGPRPYFLVNDMDNGPLKERLSQCQQQPQQASRFSIAHRGAPLMFPEHSREGYIAAARMGAGMIECDVAFTKDRGLVCRHSQCDLHSTTNILATDLAQTCRVPPQTDADGKLINGADIRCCTSDITLAEFRTLTAKMDAANVSAGTVAEYMDATPSWRTDLYAAHATLMTHKDSIGLLDPLGVDFTPELKAAEVSMPYDRDYTQARYAQQMIDEYKAAGIKPERVWPQSFSHDDIIYWLQHEPDFGRQAVFLLEEGKDSITSATLQSWYGEGIRILAPATWMLVDADGHGNIVPSQFAKNAKAAGFKLIAWTLERSGLLQDNGGWYYQSLNGDNGGQDVIDNDGDVYRLLDVLAQDVGVTGVFSDWPATTTYYANCMNKK